MPVVAMVSLTSLHDEHPELANYHGAQRIVQVDVTHIFPNGPRYVPHMEQVAPSRHIPEAGKEHPTPQWKKIPPIAELLWHAAIDRVAGIHIDGGQ